MSENIIQVSNGSVGIAPSKIRKVCDMIRNKKASEATRILRYCDKKEIAITLSKLINSGLNIAVNKGTFDLDNLRVSKVWVDEGPTLKRIQPRAQGRAFRINKRTGKITLQLQEV